MKFYQINHGTYDDYRERFFYNPEKNYTHEEFETLCGSIILKEEKIQYRCYARGQNIQDFYDEHRLYGVVTTVFDEPGNGKCPFCNKPLHIYVDYVDFYSLPDYLEEYGFIMVEADIEYRIKERWECE